MSDPALDSLTIEGSAGVPPSGDTTSAPPDTGLVARYLPSSSRRSGGLFESTSPFLGPRSASASAQSVTLDSSGTYYSLDNPPYTTGPMRLDTSAYRRVSYRANLKENWTDLIEQRQQQRRQRGGLGVSMEVPGGRESAFTTVFGKPEVDLRVNGQANIDAGFRYSKNDQQGARTGNATQLDPSFKQDLRLGITGTIGDKMKINVDWDTQSQFDFQNQVKLEYTGYEDEIIQSVEAGNVFLETPSQLISGGQSLFGIKSTLQFGNLTLTTIASQQEGQSNSLSIEGGAETTEFNLKPTDYDEDKHFFLGYYFRNNWNRAHQDPSTLTLFDQFSEITNIEVWKLRTTSSSREERNTKKIAAVVDLGESPELLRNADEYTTSVLPSPGRDQYDESDLNALRDGDTSVSTYVGSAANLEQPLRSQDVENGTFKKLERGADYRLDGRLGFLSLTQRLRSNEALAVAFEYRAGDTVREIGDFSDDQGGASGGVTGDRLVLKLLRPANPVAPGEDSEDAPPAWFLQMRNVYQLGGRGFDSKTFDLSVEYSTPGQGTQTSLPEIAGQQSLLQMLGLDRVDQSGSPNPDNEFDFLEGLTIDSERGLLYFPYLQPFGERIFAVAENNGDRSDAASFAFPELYRKKKSNAETENQEKNVYEMKGSYEGEAKGFYDLQAFTGLVDGSVKVTSGGQTLQEGTDYVVDYQSGTVNITNESYLSDGRDLNISYEQQSIANLQKKTLLGARADWSMQDQFALGATVMRLSEKSPVDKYRIGEEPIQNTIWGVDGSMELEPRWLTQAVDALPLVETRTESSVSLSGEFAQLRPGHTQTEAFEQTLENVKSSDTDSYASDERNGISYIDDFEGFENTFSLREQLNAWQVSAAPDSIAPRPNLDGDAPGNEDDLARTFWRGGFGWYRLTQQIKENLEGKTAQPSNPEATEILNIQEVFPNRDTRGSANPTLRTLDFYFNPWTRGPYNYTPTLADFLRNPKRVWGGVTRRLPEGYVDFSRQNVEFVEVIVKVYPENGEITDGSKLFVDLGTISEDVIPNEQLNTEKGLSFNFNESDLGELSRLAIGGSDIDAIEIRDNKTEDLGLDGLVSYTDESYSAELQERNFYSDFVERSDSLLDARGSLGLSSTQRERLATEVARIKDDPSADDYHHYENDRYFSNEELFSDEPTTQQRLSRYYAGYELNGFESQNQLAEDVSLRRGITGKPDTEDLDGSGGNVNFNNNYYQYAIPLDSLEARADTDAGPTDYVVSRAGQRGSNWYKLRIPVRSFTKRVGNIQDFTRIESIRFWTKGHEAPVTMRFASMELVGSQWRTSPEVAQQPAERGDIMEVGDGELRVAGINNEEDPNYTPPVGAVVSKSRTSRGPQQQNREQALLLNVDKLEPGQQRGTFKTFQQGLDLLKYSNLRMYTHVHGASNDPQEKSKIRENLRMFVRLGSDETDNYYEYEQPLKPSNVPGTEGAATPWLEENEMNLLLSALSQLKTARSQFGVSLDSTFTSDEVDLGVNEFAPDGTTLKIQGTPSLNQINSIVIGLRHAKEPEETSTVLRNVELWVNELRVSGYDERDGWATSSSANVSLADLATVQGNFQRKTDGFGALSSTLDERKQTNNMSWSARAEVSLDALLPKRQGWNIPVTMQVQSNLTEPRFDPQRGDVRVKEVQDQFDVLPDTTIEQQFADQYSDQSTDQIRETLKDSVRQASQSYSLQRTVTANLSKSGSESWWMEKTIDATSLNFSYLDRTARSPQLVVNERWSWSGSFDYQLDFGQNRTVTPLGFLPDVTILGRLSNIELNYVPTSVSVSASADRGVTTKRDRPTRLQVSAPNRRPSRIVKPFRENQNFSHNRTFSLQYDPFSFLSLGFDTNTQQLLNDVGGRTQQNLLFGKESVIGRAELTDVDTSAFFRNPQRFIDLPDTVSAGSLRDSLGRTVFIEERLRTRSEGDVLRSLFLGDASPRTDSYRQRFSSTLRLGITDRRALNWIDLQDISYQASFNWKNGSEGSLQGANVQNDVTLRTGVSLKPNKVWERFDFFGRMKEAQRGAQRDTDDESDDASSASDDQNEDADSESGEDEESANGGAWNAIPLPSPVGILRRLALTVMDIKDITVNYSGKQSARSTNVGIAERDTTGIITDVNTRYSLLDALQGEGTPLGYRFGFRRSIDPESKRVFPDGQNVTDNLTNRHRFEARTALTPSSSFNIDLNWNVSWQNQPQIEFQRPRPETGLPGQVDTTASAIERVERESGQTSASIWAFGSYKAFFQRQLATLESAAAAPEQRRPEQQVPLTRPSVTSDFRNAYLTSGLTIGGHGFIPLPLPGWTVRYSGLSDWPLIKRVTDNVSLNHGYNATYDTNFDSNSQAGDTTSVTAVGREFRRVEAEFKPQSAQIQEQFQPLIGVDITWPWDLQTSLQWNQSITTVLRGVDRVREKKTGELSGSVSYSKRGLSLPFFARIENRVRLEVSFTRSVSDERTYDLNSALQQAADADFDYDPQNALEGDNVDLRETTRLTVSPRISYSISDRVTADFNLTYEKFSGNNTAQSAYTNVNGTFNLTVSFSQN